MAEFSKQYCELHMQDFEPDFDILEVADGLPPEHYTSIICEGFGFVAVARDAQNNILLAMPTGEPSENDGETEVEWKTFEEVIK